MKQTKNENTKRLSTHNAVCRLRDEARAMETKTADGILVSPAVPRNRDQYRKAFPGGSDSPEYDKRPLLRFWLLFSVVLDKRTREQVFKPLFSEFANDYKWALQFKSKGARCWLHFCYFLKTAAMVFGCFRIMLGDRLASLCWSIVSPSVRTFIRKFLSGN